MLISLFLAVSPMTASVASLTGVAPIGEPSIVVEVEDYKSLLKAAGDDPEKLWALYEWTLRKTIARSTASACSTR